MNPWLQHVGAHSLTLRDEPRPPVRGTQSLSHWSTTQGPRAPLDLHCGPRHTCRKKPSGSRECEALCACRLFGLQEVWGRGWRPARWWVEASKPRKEKSLLCAHSWCFMEVSRPACGAGHGNLPAGLLRHFPDLPFPGNFKKHKLKI